MEHQGRCQTCGREDTLFVYALPGIAMSVGNCRSCTEQCAYPLSIAIANTEAIGGLQRAAEWWLAAITYKDGKYVPIREALGG